MPLPQFERKNPLDQVKRIVAVASGKGGVGKSTMAVNLALGLKEFGLKVGVLDADVYGPSLFQMLPEERAGKEEEGYLIPGISNGIKVVSLGFFDTHSHANLVRAPIANGVIENFIHKVWWGELDYLIIDFPPGTGDVQLSLLQQAVISGAVVVTTPSQLSVIDVRKSIEMFHVMNVPVLGVVENMSYVEGEERVYPFGKDGGEVLAKEFELPLIGRVPITPAVNHCSDAGKNLFATFPDDPAAMALRSIVHQVNLLMIQQEKEAFSPKSYQIVDGGLDLVWPDGSQNFFDGQSLEYNCPCAQCDLLRLEGRRQVAQARLVGVDPIGRYGVKFTFDGGCSKGMYTWALLRNGGGQSGGRGGE
ncbi:MAG: Iron-sulfur cluster carrier protein [Chlamydiia bacterium]|nr:Iron-sulfur cluster carrier protein [Chlamydiia bacterium]